MARRANLTCKCGAFQMVDDEHEIRHGRERYLHTAMKCDPDPHLARAKPQAVEVSGTANEPRVFRLGVTK